MKKYSRKKLARAVPALLSRHPRRDVVRLLAAELVKTRSAHELPHLIREVAAAHAAATGNLTARVTSARSLSQGAQERVKDLLKKITGAGTISLEKETNPALLGGFVAETPTIEIDASVRSRLTSLIRHG